MSRTAQASLWRSCLLACALVPVLALAPAGVPLSGTAWAAPATRSAAQPDALPHLVQEVVTPIPATTAAPVTAQMIWLTARAEAWLAALDTARPHCPVAGSAGLVVAQEQRLPLVAQLYDLSAPPLSDSEKAATAPGEVSMTLELRPRPQAAKLAQGLMQNPELLALQQRLLDDTRAAVKQVRQHWQGADSLVDVWGRGEWKRATDILQGLWLTQQALVLAPEGWLAAPTSLAALDLASRLAAACPVTHLLLAEARVQRNLPQYAIAAATEALRLWPELGRARYVRALAHWRLQQLALAEDDFTVALAPQQAVPPQGPELARRLRARGAVRLVEQKTDGLCEDFSRACALGDCDGLAHAREQGLCLPEQQKEQRKEP